LLMNDSPSRIIREGETVTVELKSGEKRSADCLLYAVGRSGNTASLALDRVGIAVGKYGNIQDIDPVSFRTKVENIYAAGDVIGPPSLASTSMEQARVAMCHAFDIQYKRQLASIIPYGIYSVPEIAGVGETQQSCTDKKVQFVTGVSKFGDHARGKINGDRNGFIKLLFSVADGKLLGAHIIGVHTTELIHPPSAAMHFG